MTEPNEAAEPDVVGWLPRPAAELFGAGATAEEAYGLLTVDVPAESWTTALETARDTLRCTYFDWLSAVDEPGEGFRVAAHVVALAPGAAIRRLLVRTTVPHDAATLPTAVGVYAGAAWHERETHEMFGIGFDGHPGLAPLLLPDNFEGHPLRKDFVLAARVAKAWPGAKEPGESDHGGPKRRQMLPPGVPDPNEWGPLKGQLPPAPARPARGARAAGDRPVRRARSASAGSASQSGEAAEPKAAGAAPAERPARRTRSASAGSASQQAAAAADAAPTPDAPAAERPARRTGGAGEAPAPERDSAATLDASGSAPAETGAETPAETAPPAAGRPARRTRGASEGPAGRQEPSADARSGATTPGATTPDATTPDAAAPATEAERPARRPRASDAPWHHARPAYDDAARQDGPDAEAVKPGAPEQPAEAKRGAAETGEPGAAEPETGQPDTARPGTDEPDTARPGPAEPGRTEPDRAAEPGGPSHDETTHPDGPPGGTA
ncbi:NADH-quinone oxidoreductase subunit C [Streptomyces sp. NBRC 110028]|uniref:NADH-quinone oxidoreductase subunit C n=1 Tax=Streptomyces sp. NBRC 110028 TaxID=1621260 RepID=UPI0006E3E3A3|nr:NADH-quinone oxidoreductase subunit C [Streptomyces sp. NBRC 110028]